MEMENFMQLSVHSTVTLREDITNNHSDPSFLSQSKSMLYLDWVLMKDWALMQAKTRDKDWVPMKEKGEQKDWVPMQNYWVPMLEDGVSMHGQTGVSIESVPD